MKITKTATPKTFTELLEAVDKLNKNDKVRTFNFSGDLNKDGGNERYTVRWSEEEAI